jgi:hypothetical protein
VSAPRSDHVSVTRIMGENDVPGCCLSGSGQRGGLTPQARHACRQQSCSAFIGRRLRGWVSACVVMYGSARLSGSFGESPRAVPTLGVRAV